MKTLSKNQKVITRKEDGEYTFNRYIPDRG